MTVHIYKDDQQFGPYSLEQIRTLLREGNLAEGDLARVEGRDSLMPVEKVSGFMPELVPEAQPEMRLKDLLAPQRKHASRPRKT